MIDLQIRTALLIRFPEKLVDELLECYHAQKRNLLLGNLRPNEVEGGRFAEAAFRLLEHFVGWTVTPLGRKINTDGLIRRLQEILTSSGVPDSVRLHIPRTLRVIYDIRNNRDAAHLGDGIDPNLQDATLVAASIDWVLAEFVRLAGGLTPDQAYHLVRRITTRTIPAVEDIDGLPKTLRPSLGASERVLLLLYDCADNGASASELSSWVKPTNRPNLTRTLKQLEYEKDLVACVNGKYKLTRRGVQEVEKRKLIEIE